jgi:hypothetical protein
MTQRHYRRGSHRTLQTAAVLTMVGLSLASIAIDVGNSTVGWSVVGLIGTLIVLVLHARLSPGRERPALRLLHSRAGTTSTVTAQVPERATG